MKANNSIYTALIMVSLLLVTSCREDLISMNENPNGANPTTANPNLVMSTVLSESAKLYVGLGYGDIAGVMQHTQKDGWTDAHNNYDWGNSNSWSAYFYVLQNNQFVYDKATELGYPLHQAVSLVMKSFLFGLVTDLWGDVPYSQALKGDEGGSEAIFPAFDSQQSIYENILSDLEQANTMLSVGQFNSTLGSADVFYGGDAVKWRKLANSLALRYYMRLSEKLPAVAQAGVEKIVNNPDDYPLIIAASDDPAMSFPGNSSMDSWPSYAVPQSDSSEYRRIKLGQTLVGKLLDYNDPRIGVWANKVQVSIHVDPDRAGNFDRVFRDTVIDGAYRTAVRIISPDVLSSRQLTLADVNQHPEYVGLPVALNAPQLYNLSPDVNQAARNPHVSWVNSTFANAKGAKARLISAAEVNFILAEAGAVYGWNVGDAKTHYENGIRASFTAWGVPGADDYLAQPTVAYAGSQEQIMIQKWIASWSVATESWFDWRRTGYPELHGVEGRTQAKELPLRFYYPLEERNLNRANVDAALENLEATALSAFGRDGAKNSPWSKPWVLQGTEKPW